MQIRESRGSPAPKRVTIKLCWYREERGLIESQHKSIEEILMNLRSHGWNIHFYATLRNKKNYNKIMIQTQWFFLSFYLFEREREQAWVGRGLKGEWEAHFPLSREPEWVSILGPWDHDPNQRQTLNRLSHPGAPLMVFDKRRIIWSH